MSFTATNIIRRCQTTLNDAQGVRWPTTELVDWINDGLRQVALEAPTVVGATVVIDLAAGTRQTLASNAATLIRVNCNVTATGQSVTTRGKDILPITRGALASHMPGWQDTSILPASSVVTYVIEDSQVPGEFYVVPGNDGTGQIEAVVAQRPTEIAYASPDPLDADNYGVTVELDDMYLTAMVDFVLSKAFAKDTTIANGMQRSQAHYASFANALGISVATERAFNPNQQEAANR